MKKFVLLGAVVGLLCFCGSALADPQILSDNELEQVTGGFLICGGNPCALSYSETYDSSNTYTPVQTTAPLYQNFSSTTTSDGITQTVIINSGGGSYQINTVSQ